MMLPHPQLLLLIPPAFSVSDYIAAGVQCIYLQCMCTLECRMASLHMLSYIVLCQDIHFRMLPAF